MGESKAKPETIPCPRCGKLVECGFRSGASSCWCGAYPPVMPVPGDGPAGCFCEDCLREMIERGEPEFFTGARGDG